MNEDLLEEELAKVNASELIDEASVIEELTEEEPSEENPADEFPELEGLEPLTNPEKYTALRHLGLTHDEAYSFSERREVVRDGRAHLTTSVPCAASSPRVGMSRREMNEAREIFGNLSDAEIQKLYKKVTK